MSVLLNFLITQPCHLHVTWEMAHGKVLLQIPARRANACEEGSRVDSTQRPMMFKWEDNFDLVRSWEWRWLGRANSGTSVEFSTRVASGSIGFPTPMPSQEVWDQPLRGEKHETHFYSLPLQEKVRDLLAYIFFWVRNNAFWIIFMLLIFLALSAPQRV